MGKVLTKFLILILIPLASTVKGQDFFFSKNLQHLYDPDAEIRVFHKVITYQDKTLLFLKLTINNDRTIIEDLITRYAFLNGYSDVIQFAPDSVNLTDFHQYTSLNNHYFRFEISNENKSKLLVLKILNKVTGNEFYFDIPSDPDAKIVNSGIVLKWPDQNIPFYRNYILKNEVFKLINLNNIDSTLYIYTYNSEFKVADPPFSSSSASVIKSIEIDSLFQVKTGEDISMTHTALCFVQSDTTNVNGIAFRVESKPFPKQGTFEDLISSLTYFTTRSELDNLRTASDKKKAFDTYWIEITKSSERARRVIKAYYARVSLANHLFTTYKQGWKTDKGMIYIVFGNPDEVMRDGEREEWIYESTNRLPRINFTFVKSKSIFTQDHYVLLRKSSYQQVWYKAIDLWRKGQMQL